ncbi:MAG: hypothetical protein H7A51_04125 [Akkermansiaceae bacterium]|nr:hypothetical protein [Akkermansiaceae bacterium]
MIDWTPKVGDGATVCRYSDRTACTIIKVSASGKTIHLQEDVATLDDWKPEIVQGGFAGHCVNNTSQRYTYHPNPEGAVYRASLRKDGRYRTTNNERVIPGRHHFHDYNF